MKYFLSIVFVIGVWITQPILAGKNVVANSGVPYVPAGSVGKDGTHISGLGGSAGIGPHGAYIGGSKAHETNMGSHRSHSATNAVANSGVPYVPAGSIGEDGVHVSGLGGSTGIGPDGAYAGSTNAHKGHNRPY